MRIFSILRLFPFVLLLIPAFAYADDGRQTNNAITLGWIAIGSGIMANLSLVVFKLVRKTPIAKLVGGYGETSGINAYYSTMLNFHIALNLVGFFAGLSHGIMLIRGLDYISLSLVIVMTFSILSGFLLKYASGRNLKLFSKLTHGQIILAVFLVALVILHVVTMGADFD